jgi:hypothetical protein
MHVLKFVIRPVQKFSIIIININITFQKAIQHAQCHFTHTRVDQKYPGQNFL